jgi:hypothetical protein
MVVKWYGQKTELTLLVTTFVSSTQLTAVIPAALLKSPGRALLFVETGDPMGDIPLEKSNSVSFEVTTPRPSINSIAPTNVAAGSRDLTITVRGSNFADLNTGPLGSAVVWSANGSEVFLATTYISSTQLTAVIPEALLASPTIARLSVQTFHGADDIPSAVSNTVTFTVN